MTAAGSGGMEASNIRLTDGLVVVQDLLTSRTR
jgi:hypothetical protein